MHALELSLRATRDAKSQDAGDFDVEVKQLLWAMGGEMACSNLKELWLNAFEVIIGEMRVTRYDDSVEVDVVNGTCAICECSTDNEQRAAVSEHACSHVSGLCSCESCKLEVCECHAKHGDSQTCSFLECSEGRSHCSCLECSESCRSQAGSTVATVGAVVVGSVGVGAVGLGAGAVISAVGVGTAAIGVGAVALIATAATAATQLGAETCGKSECMCLEHFDGKSQQWCCACSDESATDKDGAIASIDIASKDSLTSQIEKEKLEIQQITARLSQAKAIQQARREEVAGSPSIDPHATKLEEIVGKLTQVLSSHYAIRHELEQKLSTLVQPEAKPGESFCSCLDSSCSSCCGHPQCNAAESGSDVEKGESDRKHSNSGIESLCRADHSSEEAGLCQSVTGWSWFESLISFKWVNKNSAKLESPESDLHQSGTTVS